MLFSMFIKRYRLKLRVISDGLSLAPAIGVIFTYLESEGLILLPLHVVEIELACGFYIYIIGVTIIWLSLFFTKSK